MHNKSKILIGLFLAVILLVACHEPTVYFHYEHTHENGWEKSEVLEYGIPPVSQEGTYQEELALRISAGYPFMRLNLIIDQTILPSGKLVCDTLDCVFTDTLGNVIGRGIGQYQYSFPIKELHLQKGDSIHVSVRHDMRREILPGITDVGLKISNER